MRRILWVAAAMALLAGGLPTGHATSHTQKADYVTANPRIGYVENLPEQAGAMGYGGYGFPPRTRSATHVRIRNTVAGNPENGVAFTVCQDTNGNAICDEAGEPVLRGCSTGRYQKLGPGFRAKFPTYVFVFAESTRCRGLGSQGTIFLTRKT